jgi:hypothetical protein
MGNRSACVIQAVDDIEVHGRWVFMSKQEGSHPFSLGSQPEGSAHSGRYVYLKQRSFNDSFLLTSAMLMRSPSKPPRASPNRTDRLALKAWLSRDSGRALSSNAHSSALRPLVGALLTMIISTVYVLRSRVVSGWSRGNNHEYRSCSPFGTGSGATSAFVGRHEGYLSFLDLLPQVSGYKVNKRESEVEGGRC